MTFPRALLPGLALALGAPGALAADPPTFERHVRPILKAHCFPCHGEEGRPKGKLDVRLARFLERGGDSGPAVVPGHRDESVLWDKVDADEMPPGDKKLSDEEKATLAAWIDAGARTARPEPESLPLGPVPSEEERAFWSFQPIRRPDQPTVGHADQVRTPIDAFLLHRLEEVGRGFSTEADRVTLIRRATFDLLGLPPTPDEVDAFVADPRPDAYERLIDRLLASPRYGERWGRHWLDVAGYADSDGGAARDNVRGFSYKYRDYIIRSLNADRPWDELIREQLAGDEMVTPPYAGRSPEDLDRLIATGFLRMGPDTTAEPGIDAPTARNEVVAETVKIVSTALLGLTVGCAQCHAHRYDPISHEDYYRFRALFEPAYDPQNWRLPPARLVSLWSDADRRAAAEVDDEVKAINDERSKAIEGLVQTVLEHELAEAPEELRDALREARDTPSKQRSDEQRALLKEYPRILVNAGNVSLYDGKAHAALVASFAKRIDEVRAKRPLEDFVQALTEVPGQVPTTHLFARGDHEQPRQEVEPGELSILTLAGGTPAVPVDDPDVPTTGRRLAYARHLTGGQHPLVARVLINRAWLHHFGRGLVNTPGDFGALGERPSHPELLDWLADEFMRGGWTLKRMHRLIMTSTAYRQSSRRTPDLDAIDPENRLLGRASVRRLEAEALRDAILAVSGRLNPRMGGPPVPVAPDESGQIVLGMDNRDSAGRPKGRMAALGDEAGRRSVYVQVRRSMPLGVLDAFDAPVMAPNCERRNSSTVAPQALILMNNDFVLAQADAFARRVEQTAGDDPAAQVRLAWRLALAVEPGPEQVEAAVAFLARQRDAFAAAPPGEGKAAPLDPGHRALASFTQALLGSNGFLYVD